MDSGLTTVLTTTMTTVRLPDTSTYTTTELVLCLVAPSACAYGSEGFTAPADTWSQLIDHPVTRKLSDHPARTLR
jgi:hypothetical protein